uniref:COP9 signalosome subunit 7B n=1 Tax=Scleropages formosus TaxID=113540 RepID=A0A8C9R663_SCLFO
MAGVGEQNLPSLVQQFIIMAQRAEGPQLLSTISQMLEAPGVYSFGEFLKLGCVRELADGPDDAYFKLLNVFAYGTYLEYEDKLPPLTEVQKYKLRQLTLATLAGQMQDIPYSVLLCDLGLDSQQQLEDLIIKAIYAEIIRGKMDQQRKILEVEAFISRDVNYQVLNCVVNDLQEWYVRAERPSRLCPPQLPPAQPGGSPAILRPTLRYNPSSRSWADLGASSQLAMPGIPPKGGTPGGILIRCPSHLN